MGAASGGSLGILFDPRSLAEASLGIWSCLLGRLRQFSSGRSFLPNSPHPWPVGVLRAQEECKKRPVAARCLKGSWPPGATQTPSVGGPEGQVWYR